MVVACLLFISSVLWVGVPSLWAQEDRKVDYNDVVRVKKLLDDPSPILTKLHPSKVLSAETYKKVSYDVDTMKRMWADTVGFRAPDIVGKIAPEIKPGLYNYKDKDKFPGLKELMIPEIYKSFNPGAPPFGCNFPEVRIVPTKHCYWSLPIAQATKKDAGKSQLDAQGILKDETYVAGYPFPRPRGEFKANQIVYNNLKRYSGYESGYGASYGAGFSKSLKLDRHNQVTVWFLRLYGRVGMEPIGYFDERARVCEEEKANAVLYEAPRDFFGNIISMTSYLKPEKFQQILMWVSALRRVRVISASDIQEPSGMGDIITADFEGFNQQLSAHIYPYKCEVIAEREYLFPAYSTTGSEFFTSTGVEARNLEFERRPVYVVKMTQLDKNFVYGHRIVYVDRETFLHLAVENYDQKGRLYRSIYLNWGFIPETGMHTSYLAMFRDHLDLHSSFVRTIIMPDPSMSRKQTDLSALSRGGK